MANKREVIISKAHSRAPLLLPMTQLDLFLLRTDTHMQLQMKTSKFTTGFIMNDSSIQFFVRE